MFRLAFRVLRRTLNVTVLLCALVLTPLFALAHFHAPLAQMLSDFSTRFTPNPTLLHREKRARSLANNALEKHKTQTAREQASRKRAAKKSLNTTRRAGKRVLVRGAGALAVGWIPVLGTSADVVSLAEDFSELCEVFQTMDELLLALHINGENLYQENYCHMPEEGINLLQEAARDTAFEWDDEAETSLIE